MVEMGWSSNSRNAVVTAGPPLSDWTDLGKGQSPPEHASQPLIHPDQIVESIYLSAILFSAMLIAPSQPARPIDLVRSTNSKGLIWSEVVGTNRLLYRTKRAHLSPLKQGRKIANDSRHTSSIFASSAKPARSDPGEGSARYRGRCAFRFHQQHGKTETYTASWGSSYEKFSPRSPVTRRV